VAVGAQFVPTSSALPLVRVFVSTRECPPKHYTSPALGGVDADAGHERPHQRKPEAAAVTRPLGFPPVAVVLDGQCDSIRGDPPVNVDLSGGAADGMPYGIRERLDGAERDLVSSRAVYACPKEPLVQLLPEACCLRRFGGQLEV